MFEKVKTRLAQAILMVIGTIWLVSDVYDNIISNFLLTEKEVAKWGTKGDYGVVFVTTLLILGGWHLNAILRAVINYKSKQNDN